MSYRDCWHCRHWDTCENRQTGCKSAMNCPKYEAILVIYRIPNTENGYNTLLDQSAAIGVLHVTHEIDLDFKMTDGKLQFLGAWELGCSGDWTWEPDELADFEADHPGLLKEVETAFNTGAVRIT